MQSIKREGYQITKDMLTNVLVIQTLTYSSLNVMKIRGRHMTRLEGSPYKSKGGPEKQGNVELTSLGPQQRSQEEKYH